VRKEIPSKITKNAPKNLPFPKFDSNLNNELSVAMGKIKTFERNQEFVEKMWQNFVKEFLEKAPKSDDKAWFFEQLFNISYHTADYVDYVKNNKHINICYNHLFMRDNFDLSKTEPRNFEFNHVEKSTDYSNRVFKWIEELGIEHLKILIQNRLIKP
jgi:hypothetical protein